MVFEKQIVVDGRGHLVGRLASTVAKQLLSGKSSILEELVPLTLKRTKGCCCPLRRAEHLWKLLPQQMFDSVVKFL